MFQTGQKVTCVNDTFEPWVYDLYQQLPVRDRIYTIRAMQPGRSNPKFEVADDADASLRMKSADFDILVLLEELRNPADPHSSSGQELGFRIERFAEMLEQEAENFVTKKRPKRDALQLV